jgi:Kef-type K+ transport system membrane component KefB/Trk K+ transport system NAD-binding subunit
MHHEFPFLSLLLITGLAASLPLLTPLLVKLRLPLLVVEILAGIVVGRSGFNLIDTGPPLDFLATFGFTYLMFLSGLEMDYGEIGFTANHDAPGRSVFHTPLAVGLLTFGLTVLVALSISYGLVALGLIQHPLVMALILSTTSLGIVVPVLRERDLTTTRYGQTLLVAAVIADFGTMLGITVVAAVMSHGLRLDLLLVFLLLAAFVMAVRIGRLATGIHGLQRLIDELAHTTAQIQVRATFALMIGFIVLSKWLGTEVILGAFLAGTVIALLPGQDGSLLRVKMDAIGYGFFIPVFFVMVGVGFNLPALLQSSEALVLIPMLLVGAYLVKCLPALVFRLLFPWRETAAAGLLLAARLSLIIAAASIALDLGAISNAINAAIILLAIVTCTLSPVLFNVVLPTRAASTRHGMILVGLGQLSILLAERLRQAGDHVTLIGTDRTRVLEVQRRGFTVVEGDPVDADVLRAAGAESATTLIAAGSVDDVNLAACWLAREMFGVSHLVSLASDPAVAAQMSEYDIRVVQPQLATILALEGALHFPATFDMLSDPDDGVMVRETRLTNRMLVGRPLRRIRLPGSALVLGLRRDGEVLVPHGDTVLRQNDILMLVSSPEGLEEAMAWINPTNR